MNTDQIISERAQMKALFGQKSDGAYRIGVALFMARHAAASLADVRETSDIERAKYALTEALRELNLATVGA